MAINYVTTANTFGEWVIATGQLITVANALTDGPQFTGNTSLRLTANGTSLYVSNTAQVNGTLLINGANTALNVANDAYVGGNLVVHGFLTLDNIGFNDLVVSGNTTSGNIYTANVTNTNNLIVLANATINLITGAAVSQFDPAGTGVAMAIALG